MTEAKIFLGCKIGDSLTIPYEAFNQFVKEVIDRELPGGYTLLNAVGHWQGLEESSHVLIALDADPQKIINIAEAYKSRFKQEAILITKEAIETEMI